MPSAKERILIVDGHSIIHAWDDLAQMHRGNDHLKARLELKRRLQTYQDAVDDHVLLVFDGNREKSTTEQDPEGIRVVYSDSSRTADDIIERLVARYADDYDIRVATADGTERMTVAAFGGWPISPDTLRVMVEQAEADLARRIRSLGS